MKFLRHLHRALTVLLVILHPVNAFINAITATDKRLMDHYMAFAGFSVAMIVVFMGLLSWATSPLQKSLLTAGFLVCYILDGFCFYSSKLRIALADESKQSKG